VGNQYTAPDDFGIDNQLRPWGWSRAWDNCSSLVDVLIRRRIPSVVIVLFLLLDMIFGVGDVLFL
jgi:hypothetical protein